MQDDHSIDLEQVSALADGQLGAAEFELLALTMRDSSQARAAWHSYHVIGDVLRTGELPDCSDDAAFVARLRARMAQEPEPVPAVRWEVATVHAPAVQGVVGRPEGRSANDPSLRWRWLAAAASLAVVAVLGWNVTRPTADVGARLADAKLAAPRQLAAAPSASAQAPVMLRDPRLDELLAAHRQYGGASALPTAAGFLRNATFEQPER